MARISKETLKKLYLLQLIRKFKKGVIGSVRLQKVAYYSEENADERPFTFKHYSHGQYSEDLTHIKDELIAMGLIDSGQLSNASVYKERISPELSDALDKIFNRNLKHFNDSIKRAVDEYGYEKHDALYDIAHTDKRLEKTNFDEEILKENLPRYINIPSLSSEEAEDLELCLNKRFLGVLRKRIEAIPAIVERHKDWRAVLENV